VHIDADGIDLSRVPLILQKLGVPITGVVDADIDVDSDGNLEKGDGHIKLKVKNASVQPGSLKAGLAGSFELAKPILLGDVVLSSTVKSGIGTIDVLKLDGTTDINAELTGNIALKGKLMMSRLDTDGWFRPTPGLLEKEQKLKSALELAEKLEFPGRPSLSKAKDDEGRYHFALKGSLQSIQPTLSKDGGKKAGAKPAVAPTRPKLPAPAPPTPTPTPTPTPAPPPAAPVTPPEPAAAPTPPPESPPAKD
jgi:type II secretion system protein N